MRQLTSGLNFPEGPVALSDGSLLVGEIATGTIARVAADGALIQEGRSALDALRELMRRSASGDEDGTAREGGL